MKEVTLNVTGMSCGHCKGSVEGALNDVDGVQFAKVDLDAAAVTIKFDDAKVIKDDLKAVIEDAGPYEVN